MTLDITVSVLSRGKGLSAQRQGAGWRQLATNDNKTLCIPVPISRSSKAVECGWEKAGEGARRPNPPSADGGGSVEWEWLVGSKQSHQAAAGRGLPRLGIGHGPRRLAPWLCQSHCGLSTLAPLSPRLGGVGRGWGLNWPSEPPWALLWVLCPRPPHLRGSRS